MTQIVLGHSIHKLKSFEKSNAVIAAWDKIVEASRAPRGSRFMMSMSTGTVPGIRPLPISEEEKRQAENYLGTNQPFELK
jgi:hypothetical protein